MKTFHLKILTPDCDVFSGDVNSIVVEAQKGKLGVLANHAPLFAKLRNGIAKIKINNKEQYFFLSDGFLQVKKNSCFILCESGEKVEDINLNRAKSALKKADERLHKKDKEIDKERAKNAMIRAKIRLELAKKFQKQ
jgi:F-type H+-transporting ATPase subunit epsilon